MEKINQERHISGHDIAKEINIDHKTVLNHLKNVMCKKETRRLGCILAFNGLNLH